MRKKAVERGQDKRIYQPTGFLIRRSQVRILSGVVDRQGYFASAEESGFLPRYCYFQKYHSDKLKKGLPKYGFEMPQ